MPATKNKMSFKEACSRYVHRFTMDHVPAWAQKPFGNGLYPAPQFASDAEWYEHTRFPPDPFCYKTDCYTSHETWPLGKSLERPFQRR